MSRPAPARVFSIPAGIPFLDTLAGALLDGTLVPGFRPAGDPLALADATIYVPTRRAARALRSIFVERCDGRAAILPTVRPLGDIDEDGDAFLADAGELLDEPPPMGGLDRLLLLAPLVQQWKNRIPAHLARLYGEGVVVPASAADAIWLARDLAALMDEIETEEADWSRLAGLVEADHAGWWQLTLEFLSIVTSQWPAILQAYGRSNPALHRRRAIEAETRRLALLPRNGPIIAAGSTGSIPAADRYRGNRPAAVRPSPVRPAQAAWPHRHRSRRRHRDRNAARVHGSAHPRRRSCDAPGRDHRRMA
jgi:ATP-dependent helicase/nuclease subunit B